MQAFERNIDCLKNLPRVGRSPGITGPAKKSRGMKRKKQIDWDECRLEKLNGKDSGLLRTGAKDGLGA